MTTVHYAVSGLTCGGCVAKVKALLTPFADAVEVTLDPPQALLNNPRLDLDALNQILQDTGKYALSKSEPTAQQANTPIQPTHAKGSNGSQIDKHWVSTYYPLLLIIGFISLTTLLIQFSSTSIDQAFDMRKWMTHFMAGFFLVFAFFKLLDIKGFASSYAMYDLLAMRINTYGLIYPFIELALGILYLLDWQPVITNTITFAVMLFSSIGVIRSVINKQKIRCACLGSVFNLPMSTVTIIEDLAMAGMALIMLV